MPTPAARSSAVTTSKGSFVIASTARVPMSSAHRPAAERTGRTVANSASPSRSAGIAKRTLISKATGIPSGPAAPRGLKR